MDMRLNQKGSRALQGRLYIAGKSPSGRPASNTHCYGAVCPRCNRRVFDAQIWIQAFDMGYHPNCLQCRHCKHKIGDSAFTIVDTPPDIQISKDPFEAGSYYFCCMACSAKNPASVLGTFAQSPTENPIFDLPKEILHNIVSFLSVAQKHLLRRVSQSLYHCLVSMAPVPSEFRTLHVKAHCEPDTTDPHVYSKLVPTFEPVDSVTLAYHLHKPGHHRTELFSRAPELVFRKDDPFISSDLLVFPVSINDWGASKGRPLFCKTYPCMVPPSHCWNGEALVKAFAGGYLCAEDVKEGDVLMSASGAPTIVKQVLRTRKHCHVPMVKMDDFYITPGHPIYHDSDWYRPDEVHPVEPVWIGTLFNFYCQPHHELLIGRTNKICSSLGGYCPRLVELDPYSDILFGRGYGTKAAARYAWLLSLSGRIPDHLVEVETENYWTSKTAN